MFLVKVDDEVYFTRRTKSSVWPSGTPYIGGAKAFSYPIAFLITQRLKEMGYIGAFVCMPDGRPATEADINAPADLQTTAEFQLAWYAD
jgi:hypothetical protein